MLSRFSFLGCMATFATRQRSHGSSMSYLQEGATRMKKSLSNDPNVSGFLEKRPRVPSEMYSIVRVAKGFYPAPTYQNIVRGGETIAVLADVDLAWEIKEFLNSK